MVNGECRVRGQHTLYVSQLQIKQNHARFALHCHTALPHFCNAVMTSCMPLLAPNVPLNELPPKLRIAFPAFQVIIYAPDQTTSTNESVIPDQKKTKTNIPETKNKHCECLCGVKWIGLVRGILLKPNMFRTTSYRKR